MFRIYVISSIFLTLTFFVYFQYFHMPSYLLFQFQIYMWCYWTETDEYMYMKLLFQNSIWTNSSPIWIISNHTIDQHTNSLLAVFFVIGTSSSLRSFALLYNRLTSRFILVPNNVKIFLLFVTWNSSFS